MIKQIHLNQCHSTQDVLKEQFKSGPIEKTILVSCENQIAGKGRGQNNWVCMNGTICFSLNIKPHLQLSFTAIELSVIIAEFFQTKNRSLYLKWPNDLWNDDYEKCGGILVQGGQNNLFAGIGLNMYSSSSEFGGIFEENFPLDKKSLSLEIAEYLINNRIIDSEILKYKWLKRCGHLNKMVTISEGEHTCEGIFAGIGEYGEALITTPNGFQKIYNGSLKIN